MDTFVSLVVAELGKQGFKPQIDVQSIINETQSKLKGVDMTVIEKYFNTNGVLKQIVSVCTTNLEKVLEDGKIDLNDTSYFINIIKEIYVDVNKINMSNVNIKIDASTLVMLCGFILQIVLAYTINNKRDLTSALAIVKSAVELVSFSMSSTTWSFKCWQCCNRK